MIGASVGLAAKRAGVGEVVGSDPENARGARSSAARSTASTTTSRPTSSSSPSRSRSSRRAFGRRSRRRAKRRSRTSARPRGRSSPPRGRSRASSAAIPSAARRRAGPAHATADLFEGATWFLTPVAHTDADRYRTLHGFVSSLGSTPVAIDPRAHDRLVAMTSHLPHVLANVILNQAGAARIEGHDPLAAAGGSLRDMTRVAGANPRIWVDIFLDNARRAPRRARRAPAADRAGRGGARRRRRRLPRTLDRRGCGEPARDARGRVPGSRRSPARARARPGPSRRARGDHAGARGGADQHRGLRAAARVGGARRHADAAGRGRGAGGARRVAAGGAGLRRGRRARGRAE